MTEKPISEFLTYRLSVLSNIYNRQMERLLKQQFGVALPDWRVIAHLGQFGAMSAKELVSRSQMDKGLVSRIVNRLAQRELVRTETSSSDKRSVTVALTEQGIDLYVQIKPFALDYQQRLTVPLSIEEQATLEAALDKLTEYARELEH